jgi:riboflavin synthase alpha subunit
MVFMGSVGIDGVSLTIADMTEDSSASISSPIPTRSLLRTVQVGDAATTSRSTSSAMFVRRYVERARRLPRPDWESLRQTG